MRPAMSKRRLVAEVRHGRVEADGVQSPDLPGDLEGDAAVPDLEDDGLGGDAADATPADLAGDVAPVLPVTVTVYDDGVPVEGAAVAFHDGAGQLVAETVTAADGGASSGAVAVAMVTAVVPGGKLASIAGLEPGDEVVLGMPAAVSAVVGTASVSSSVAVPNTADYVVELGANAAMTADLTVPAEVEVKAHATRASGTFSVLAHAWDDGGVPIAYAYAREQALVEGAATEVVLSDWTTQFGEIFVSVKDSPAQLYGVIARAAPVADDVAYYALNPPISIMPAMTNTFLFGIPTEFGESVEYVVFLQHYEDGLGSGLVVRDSTRPNEVLVQAPSLLPRVKGVKVAKEAGVGYVVGWEADEALAAADGVLVSLACGGAIWTVLAPADAGGLALPLPPASLEGPGFGECASAATAEVTFVDADFIPDFGTLKREWGPRVMSTPFGRDDVHFRHSSGSASTD